MSLSAASGSVTAPAAPGRMGVELQPTQVLVYLEQLGQWCDGRQSELDQLDQAALQSPNGVAATGDITLSMALWKAVADRYEQLRSVWDSGRAGPTERIRLSTLIWGRLDTDAATGLAVSLPEACRLSDALASSLRVRLGLEVSGAEITERIRQLRAQMERIRDQVTLEPAGPAQQQAAGQQSRLARRLKEIADKAARGGDVGGLLGPLEIDAATFERDLIVGGAQRREAATLVRRAEDRRIELEAREAGLRNLAAECVRRVEPAPRYAVPDVELLGPVPGSRGEVETYLRRLDQVSRAMTVAEQAYGKALGERRELADRLDAYRAKATATGVADHPDLARAYAMAREALDRQPCRMVLANQLVTLYQTYLQLEAS
ncbi:MAG TPA: hypothetical protein VE476_05490 [Propionibacteriaceae bacterium]|nr:hypothetical protein [Propionibacteriaceae bacterium]